MEEIKLNEEEFQDDYLLNGLTADGEVLELAKVYCASLKKFKPLTKEEEKRLFEEYNKSHNSSIRKGIIERHLRFVVWFITKNNIKINGMDFMDVVQEGNYILVRAFEKFKLKKGFRFLSYLYDSLTNKFITSKYKNNHYLHMGHNTAKKYNQYIDYIMEYKAENGIEPSKNEVIATFKITGNTYEAFKNMKVGGNSTLSLDKTVNDEENEKLYDIISSEFSGFDDYENFVDNRLLLWRIKKILTPMEYYIFYNYTVDPKNYRYEKLGSILGVSHTSIWKYIDTITTKIKILSVREMRMPNDFLKRIEKIDFMPIDFAKKVILIYINNKLSMEEFYYVYNAWYMNFDEETLERKFNKFGINYKELRLSMQDTVDNLNYLLNGRYQDVLKIVKKKFSVAQIFELDLTINMDYDYQISKFLDNLTYDQVIKILGSNYEKLDNAQKKSLYSYYNWNYKWRRLSRKQDIESKINLKRHGFKRKRHVALDKIYKIYLDNLDMFEDSTKEVLEGSLFSPYTHKKGKIKDNSSAYYRSLWRLEEKYYKLDNYFSFDIPKRDYFRILREYNYIFTKDELYVLDAHSEFKKNRATFEEIATEMDISANEVDGIYLWAKNKILLLYLGLYSAKVIDNEPLYVAYINDPKFDITPRTREIGRMRFIEHLSYDEIANKVNLEDDEACCKKKSKTTKTQKVSNIVTKLIRLIEIHHYNILNEVNMEVDKVLSLLDKLNYRGEERNIINDFYVEKLTMDILKSKYGKTQPEINTVVMKFKYNYISNYKKDVELDDIIYELKEHVTDTVLTDDQRVVMAYLMGVKCSYNPLGEKKSVSDIAIMIGTSEKDVSTIYSKGVFHIGAKMAGIIGSDLGRLKRSEVIEALEDKNLPLTDEEKNLIREFKGIDTDTKSLEELGEKYHVNATSIKRRIQNIYLSILKYQDGEMSKKYDFDIDITPVLKYLPLYYQNLIVDMYRDNLNNKEIALKYGIDYEKARVEIGNANKRLYYLLKCPKAKFFDFDYARGVINNPDLPYYDDEAKDVVYIFNRLMGNDGEEPATKKKYKIV